jgi:hypothetical protein
MINVWLMAGVYALVHALAPLVVDSLAWIKLLVFAVLL